MIAQMAVDSDQSMGDSWVVGQFGLGGIAVGAYRRPHRPAVHLSNGTAVQPSNHRSPTMNRPSVVGVLTVLLVFSMPLRAQQNYTSIQWWHPLAAAAGVAVIFAVDEPLREFFQDVRSAGTDDLANVVKRGKEPILYQVSGLGALGVGLLARQPKVARTGLQILGAYGLSGGMVIVTKWAFGRSRPSDTPGDVTNFDWFHGSEDNSFPSGTSAITFSLATTASDAIGHPAAAVALFTGASLTSWSRLNDNRHWMSDIALGALLGVTAAKVVNGRWRVFGLRPPSFLVGPNGQAGFQYRASF